MGNVSILSTEFIHLFYYVKFDVIPVLAEEAVWVRLVFHDGKVHKFFQKVFLKQSAGVI